MELTERQFDESGAKNLTLANGKWKKFLDEANIKQSKRGFMARILENQHSWMQSLDEETKVATIGGFDKYVFPTISNIYPNLVATELVSVQPMNAPTGLIFYRDTRFGTSKGAVKAGQPMFSARTGWNDAAGFDYSSEVVKGEVIEESTGTGVGFSGALAWGPIRPGSVVISYTNVLGAPAVLTDDGAGGWIGAAGELAGTNTIDYSTKAYQITFDTGKDPAAGEFEATYDANMEGNPNVPQVDLQLTSTPVHARTPRRP